MGEGEGGVRIAKNKLTPYLHGPEPLSLFEDIHDFLFTYIDEAIPYYSTCHLLIVLTLCMNFWPLDSHLASQALSAFQV